MTKQESEDVDQEEVRSLKLNESLRLLATEMILNFFSNKKCPEGRPLEKSKLVNHRNISLVLTAPFNSAYLPAIHKTIDLFRPADFCETNASWSTAYMLGMIQDFVKCKVPVAYQTGMMILYLENCKGVEICR